MLPGLIFLTRDNCCLCESAWQIVSATPYHLSCQQRNIDENLDLIRRFGDQVPVLASDDLEHVLAWPFDQAAVRLFVQRLTQ